MKGIVFNLLEDAVVRYHGSAAWRAMCAASGGSAEHLPQQDYTDDDLATLVRAAGDTLELPPFEVLRWLGYEIAPQLAEAYPELFAQHSGGTSLAVQLEAVLQPERRDGKASPELDFETGPDGAFIMRYRSPRRLCGLAQGFLEGIAHVYGQEAQVEHRLCMLRGDAQCLCIIYFSAGWTN